MIILLDFGLHLCEDVFLLFLSLLLLFLNVEIEVYLFLPSFLLPISVLSKIKCMFNVCTLCVSIKTHEFRSVRILALFSFWSPAPVYLIPLHLTHFNFFWSVARPHQMLQRDCDRFRPEFIANILLPTMVEKPLLMVVVLQRKKLMGILLHQDLYYKGYKD